MTEAMGLAFDQDAERATLGAILLTGDPRTASGLIARGLRPDHFYYDKHAQIFKAIVALADRAAGVDTITVCAELDRLGMRDKITRPDVDVLPGYVPAAGHYAQYADRVIDLARWRDRQAALHRQQVAVAKRDESAWSRATADLERAVAGTRTESYSAQAWADLLFDHYSRSEKEVAADAVPTPFIALNDALGGGIRPGEWCALSGATGHGKSVYADQWLDAAAKAGKRCHLYMTEMTALARGMRYMARNTGVPFMAQRRGRLNTDQKRLVLDELGRLPYGCTVAADWVVDDIVHDALQARYDFVVVDLLHGFHYQDERALDRLSKAVQRLARVSTTLDGHPGTAVVAVCHLKEEGMVRGKVPRPGISSIKGGSSIKQDADFVCFVWREQDEGGAATDEGCIWLAKGRGSGLESVDVVLNPRWFRFQLPAGQFI